MPQMWYLFVFESFVHFLASEEAVLGRGPWLLLKEYDYYLGRLSALSVPQELERVNLTPR